jgi:hypothetical protein
MAFTEYVKGIIEENYMNNIIALETVASNGAEFRPRYNLTDEELQVLDGQIVGAVKESHPEEGVYAALIGPNHPFSNFVRRYEADFFPEAADFPAELEDNTVLFALVDTRPASNRVVHVGTVSGPGLHRETTTSDESSGFLFVDELVELGNFTPDEFRAHYAERGIDLDKSIAVETNIRVGDPVEKYNGVRTVDLGYLTLFGLIERNNPEAGKAAVFASINSAQAISFGRVGITCEPLMDRNDFVTPESFQGRTSTPVAVTYDEHCQALFGSFGPQLPSVTFGME